jgi:rare lipoprotein A (peptidoglycan hydrolase)
VRGLVLALAFLVSACASSTPKQSTTTADREPAKKKKKGKKAKPKKKAKKVAAATTKHAVGNIIRGRAVWYGKDWHGKATASGQRFNRHKLTAAHRTLPLGAKVRVTNERNGKSVVVRINDRGPYGKDRRRIIDLSEAAARKLDYLDAGWTEVTIEVLELPE